VPAVIEIENLTKFYGKFKALDQINLQVNQGEIYGFLGLNGAGKTTTIKSIMGMIWPSSGKVIINGQNVTPASHGPWEKVGCLIETANSYPELTVKQNLEIYRRLRGLINSPDPVAEVMEKLNITKYSQKKARELSLGNKQRLGLAKAMIHKPELLVLDEPANGLDPAGIVEIRNILTDLARNKNTTIFISSHHLAEISKTADRIGIIDNGILLQDLKSSDLKKKAQKHLVIKTRNKEKTIKLLKNSGYEITTPDGRVEPDLIYLNGNISITTREKILNTLIKENTPPYEIKLDEENLESYFLRILQENRK